MSLSTSTSTSSTLRSRSRSKRSTTNLSDLRLAPLSTKFAEPPVQRTATSRKLYDEDSQHSSYLQGRSAPTTPGILSCSSSRRHLGGGLSRKNSIYDNDDGNDADEELSYAYSAPAIKVEWVRTEFRSSNIPKAKSEAALLAHEHDRLSGPGVPLSKRYRHPGNHQSGTVTPRQVDLLLDESWLTHTGATASALIQEHKGLSWLASQNSSTNLVVPESEEDEEDEQYEELAALSASTAKLHLGAFEGASSPVSTRVSRWGSRYSSRTGSKRTSRLGSPVGSRTPRNRDSAGYFDQHVPELPIEEPAFRDIAEGDEDYDDQLEVERLSQSNSFGLGNLVDQLMNFNIFKGDEGTETTDDEKFEARDNETVEEAQTRRDAEMLRRQREKEKLVSQPPPALLGDAEGGLGEVGRWQDAAWLLSVASKAMF